MRDVVELISGHHYEKHFLTISREELHYTWWAPQVNFHGTSFSRMEAAL